MIINANAQITIRKIKGIDFEAFIAATSLMQLYHSIL